MSNDYEGQPTMEYSRRSDDREGRSNGNGPIRMDLPNVERDGAGIPTFIFKDNLAEDDKPTKDKRTLEVVLLWREAVMRVGHYTEAKPITVGDAVKNDFRVAAEGLPVDRYALLQPHDDGEFIVHWTDAMSMEVRDPSGLVLGQKELDDQHLINRGKVAGETDYQYTLGLNDRVAVQVGEVTFVVQYVSPVRVLQTSFLASIDYYFTKILALSAMAHLFLLLALIFSPVGPSNLEDDLFKNPNRFAKLILKEPEKKPVPKKLELSGSKGGGKHKNKEGKFGKPDKPKKDALASKKGAPRVDPNKREKDRKIALQSGIFKALKGGKGAVSNVFGPGGLGTGVNNALGGLRGASMGDAGGAGGLGSRGTGGGGGGNSLGIGGLGNGSGRGTGGLGNVDLGGRGKGKYKVIPGRTITKGCLTQSQVLRVINRVQSQAKYCYEKELNRNPNLAGKVTTRMEISATGAVSWVRVAQSTLANANVEKCLVRVMQRMRFPPCKGGGTAEITYPWIFKSSGN